MPVISDLSYLASFLLDSISDAVISTDLDFIIKSWNKGPKKYTD